MNNLGVLFYKNQELEKSKIHYAEALQIGRQLVKKESGAFLPDIAMTLNNLGLLFDDIQELKKSKKHYKEALEIRRELAEKNSIAFLPDLAETLNNLANLYSKVQELKKSEIHYMEALQVYRQLAKKNPNAFLPYLAGTLNNLGLFFNKVQNLKKSKKYYKEALQIKRELAEKNPNAFLPDLAITLNNLGDLFKNNQELEKSEKHYLEALQIGRQLAKKNPKAYDLNVCKTSINVAILFYEKLQKTPKYSNFQQRGLELLKDIEERLKKYGNYPIAKHYMSYVEHYRGKLENFHYEKEKISEEEAFKQISFLLEQLTKQKDSLFAIKNYSATVEKQLEELKIYENLWEAKYNVTHQIVSSFGLLSWYQLFTKDFSTAQSDAKKALRIDSTQTWIIVNLANALLFQGKKKEAMEYYQKYKNRELKAFNNRIFKEAVLADLKGLKIAGVVPKEFWEDVEAVRRFLTQ